MKYDKHMKMSELMESNYHLLGIVWRLGIDGSFSERSVEDVCKRYDINPDTFLLLCAVYSGKKVSEEELRRCSIEDLLRYIRSSHEYYLNSALVSIGPVMDELLAPTTPARREAIGRFFRDYRSELVKHFAYEEDVLLPYVQSLLDGKPTRGFSIAEFEKNHTDIQESLSDLKNIVMQSLPPECDGGKRLEVLSTIFHLQEDLGHHTYIEDHILVPLVEMLEGKRPDIRTAGDSASPDNTSEELSDREKEVLVQVAKVLLNKEIADKLNISINTVITHRKNITRKTGIKTAPGLTVYAILGGLIDLESLE
jgi:regulator of cell morphogenesis and NO signaling